MTISGEYLSPEEREVVHVQWLQLGGIEGQQFDNREARRAIERLMPAHLAHVALNLVNSPSPKISESDRLAAKWLLETFKSFHKEVA